MWPVSRREAILHFAQNSAETSRSVRVRRPEDLSCDLSEKTRCGFHRTGPTSLQPVRSLKAPDMGTVHTQGCGPLFRWRLLVVAATAVDDLPQRARRHVQARRELLERHPRIMPSEYSGDLRSRQRPGSAINRMSNCLRRTRRLCGKALHLIPAGSIVWTPLHRPRQSRCSFLTFHC